MRFKVGLFFTLIVNLVLGQSSRINDFGLSKTDNNKVIVSWTMNAGSTCFDLAVERYIDNQFKTVYTYPGICGDFDEETYYNWVDESVSNYTKQTYRIRLEQGEYTKPLTIDLDSDLAENDVVLFPNPTNEVLHVKFRNEEFNVLNIEILDSNGHVFFKGNTQASKSFRVSIANFPSGLYYIRIFDASYSDQLVKSFLVN